MVGADPGPSEDGVSKDSIWSTFDTAEYVVLAVARTWTSAYRLLEAAEWFRDDFRIRLYFAVDDTSAFSVGVHDLLRTAGVRLVAWSEIRSQSFRYQLVLSASENIDFDAIDTHTILLPHGLGFNKLLPTDDGRVRLAGLPPSDVIRKGNVTITLSHAEQRRQLEAIDPAIAAHTEIVGDPTFDRLQASRNLRESYRRAFGTGDRTSVVIASTWGRESVIGRWRTLPAELLAATSADTHQFQLVMHPNVWSYYGRLQITLWLRTALDAGLVLVPPESGWQAALIAADQVVTDHGSLAMFAAALGRPVLMAGSAAETVSGTPIHDLTRAARILRPGADLARQLADAREHHSTQTFAPITGRVFDHVGDATGMVQRLIYDRLGLTPPAHTGSPSRIAIPRCRIRTPTSYVVWATWPEEATLVLNRIPATVWRHREHPERHETHIVALNTELDLKILERTAVLIAAETLDSAAARRWGSAMLAEYPGARLAVSPTPVSCVAVARGGLVIETDSPPKDQMHTQLIGSALYYWFVDARAEGECLTVRAGQISLTVTITTRR